MIVPSMASVILTEPEPLPGLSEPRLDVVVLELAPDTLLKGKN